MSFIEHFKNGGFVIVADDINRENELDLIIAAEHITPEKMNSLIRWGTGVICIPMTKKIAISLNLSQMVSQNKDPNGTNYTISIDSKNCTTGVSAYDRFLTVKDLLSLDKNLIRSPGHMFPLVAHNELLNKRRGHTEASVQLCLLANLTPIAIIVEIINDDGTMTRLSDIKNHPLLKDLDAPVITIDDIINESHDKMFEHPLLKKDPGSFKNDDYDVAVSSLNCSVKNSSKPFEMIVFKDSYRNTETSMLVYPSFDYFKEHKDNLPIRVHSECLTGNIFHSMHCDCGFQLDKSMEIISNEGPWGGGAIIYAVSQEGRGIGLYNKIKAYNIQQTQNVDTYEANVMLGFKEDERNYSEVISILKFLNINKLNLLSNNPEKEEHFKKHFEVKILPFEINKTYLNEKYINSKINKGTMLPEQVLGLPAPGTGLPEQVSEIEKKLYTNDISKNIKGKIAIISTCWNKPHIEILKNNVLNELKNYPFVTVDEFSVPGSWEIPVTAKLIYSKYDAIIVLGVLIKGETKHFEYIAKNVFNGLMNVQIETRTPIINGVLTVLAEHQIPERYPLGKDWAVSALQMIQLFDKQ